MDPVIALSLGAGVQSTTLALMACEGVLPKPDCAIFADTGWEPVAVYEHLAKLALALAAAGIPLYRVDNGDLRADSLDPAHRYNSVPFHVLNGDGTRGIGRRQCTHEYKLKPIRRKVRELLGAKAPDFKRVPKGAVCEQWIGFSTDEVQRVNTARDSGGVGYLMPRYPLLELGFSRKDCHRWLTARGWTTEKSACIGCPFHGNAQWRRLRDRPKEWADAVAFDEAIRAGGVRPFTDGGQAFLHRSLQPLATAPIDRVSWHEWKDRQVDLLDLIADENGDEDGCSPYGCRSGEAIA